MAVEVGGGGAEPRSAPGTPVIQLIRDILQSWDTTWRAVVILAALGLPLIPVLLITTSGAAALPVLGGIASLLALGGTATWLVRRRRANTRAPNG